MSIVGLDCFYQDRKQYKININGHAFEHVSCSWCTRSNLVNSCSRLGSISISRIHIAPVFQPEISLFLDSSHNYYL